MIIASRVSKEFMILTTAWQNKPRLLTATNSPSLYAQTGAVHTIGAITAPLLLHCIRCAFCEKIVSLNDYCCYVPHALHMAHSNPVMAVKFHASYGTIVLDHLAADGAGFPGGQVTVVTVGQVDADLGSGLHLELVHCLACLGNIDLVVVLHSFSLLLLSWKGTLSEESIFSFRNHSFAEKGRKIRVSFRKAVKKRKFRNKRRIVCRGRFS